jgi:hypothetical protein
MRAVEYATAVANAKDTFHTSHSAGVSSGYGQAIKHLLSLAISCQRAEADANKDERGETDREVDELLTRISP